MKARSLLRHLFALLTLLAGLSARPAWAAGTTPQTLTWTGGLGEAFALNVAHPLGATAAAGCR